MNSNKLWMTAQTPSAFGMPISGHTSCVVATEARTAVATTLVVRDRVAFTGIDGAVKAGNGLALSYFPGTSAWSPPTC